jgi:hypothetical protein
MTIKQNGGVFGRNPTFNDVTIEGQLTFDGDIDVNSDLRVSGDLVVDGDASIGNTAPTGNLTISEAAGPVAPTSVITANTYLQLGSKEYGASSNGKFMIGFGYTNGQTNTNSPAYLGYEEETSSGNTFGSLTFYTRSANSDSAPVERLRVDRLGHVNVQTGNLVIGTSGQGIDFSATAGTGTSELFDDYEEGTFTCNDASGGGNAIVTNHASYTKIGNAVTISVYITVPAGATGAGALLGGLPFASATNSNVMVAQNTGGLDIIARTNSSTYLIIYPSGSGSASTWLSLAGDDVYITGTYYV